LLNCGEQAIEVCKIRGITLNTCDVFTNFFDCGIQFSLAMTYDEDIRTFSYKTLRSGKTHATGTVGDNSDFSSSFCMMMNPVVVEG
jgi:hypothetical protein